MFVCLCCAASEKKYSWQSTIRTKPRLIHMCVCVCRCAVHGIGIIQWSEFNICIVWCTHLHWILYFYHSFCVIISLFFVLLAVCCFLSFNEIFLFNAVSYTWIASFCFHFQFKSFCLNWIWRIHGMKVIT